MKIFRVRFIAIIFMATFILSREDVERASLSSLFLMDKDSLQSSRTNTTEELIWYVQISAHQDEMNDMDNYLGIADGATDGFDNEIDVLEPPPGPGNSIQVYFPHPEWENILGDNFSSDIRSEDDLADHMQVWDFVVVSTQDGEVTLEFSLNNLPEVPIIMEDMETGDRTTIGDQDSLIFTVFADEERELRISIGDVTGPVIAQDGIPTGPAIYPSGTNVDITWSVNDGFLHDSTFVFNSLDGGESYQLLAELSSAVTSYEWMVPEVDSGVNHECMILIEAVDYASNSSTSMSEHPFTIVGNTIQTEIYSGWTLWGAPIDPDVDSMHVNIGDDFDGYWDTFDYLDGGYTYDGFLTLGKGYWLGTMEDAEIDVSGTVSAEEVSISLSEGWELISNPLVLDVALDSLQFSFWSDTKTYQEALEEGWINALYGYGESGYEEVEKLMPWRGYWISVLLEGILVTFPIHAEVEEVVDVYDREEEWYIDFQADIENAQDNMLTIGCNENATDDFDEAYDAFTPPPSPASENVSLSISHEEWGLSLGDDFSKDIRSLHGEDGDIKEWAIDIESSSEYVNLEWSFFNVPDDYQIGYSTDGGIYFEDLREQSLLTLDGNGQIIIRVGTEILSSFDDGKIPGVFSLSQNYPNPFNPSTTIQFVLPEDEMVELVIHDMSGARVRTLISGQRKAGVERVRWNGISDLGNTVSAGVYVYTIKAGVLSQSKKMIFMK